MYKIVNNEFAIACNEEKITIACNTIIILIIDDIVNITYIVTSCIVVKNECVYALKT